MSGVVKSVKKAFKAVVKFVKKAIPYVLMAAAVYFTAGVALSAFAPTAGFAASLPGFAGGGFAGLGIGAGAVPGAGIFTKAAAAIGLGNLGSAGGLVGGALAKGTSAAALAGAGISQSAIATGATEAISAGILTSPTAALGGAGAAGAVGAAGAAAPAAGAAGAAAPAAGAAAKAGMSIGEKLLLASTGSQAVGALLSPKAKDPSRFHGAFYGMDRKGKGGGAAPLPELPGTSSQDPATSQAPPPEQTRKAPMVSAPPPAAGQQPQSTDLFAQGATLATGTPTQAGSRFDVQQADQQGPDLFAPMAGVRYVR